MVSRLNSHWKIVLTVALLNVLGELAFRSFQHVASIGPIFFVYLFVTYFSFAVILESQIVTRRLDAVGLALAAFCLGLVWQISFPLASFAPPRVFGLNPAEFIFVTISMWPIVQGLLFFYLAQRVFPRNTEEKFISKRGQVFFIFLFILPTLAVHAYFRFAGFLNPFGYLMLVAMLVIALIIYLRRTPETKVAAKLEPHNLKTLDFLGALSILILVYCSFFIRVTSVAYKGVHIFNKNAFPLVLGISTITTIVILYLRFVKKRGIPV